MDSILNELIAVQTNIIESIPLSFKRYLYSQINWNSRMITITGARGTGKTTMVLQYSAEEYNGDFKKCLYISADNTLVLKKGLYNTASEYFKYYGECIIIDEVHKYADWANEVKSLYDANPNKKFIILGSSKLNILNQKGDLSRRTLIYNLKILSFREYLNLILEKSLSPFSLTNIINDHMNLSITLKKELGNILGYFKDYLKFGAYPFFQNFNYLEYKMILNNILDKIIYEDVPSLKILKSSSIMPIKKLLAFLAISKIPTINISSLCNEIGTSRDTLYDFLDLLARADLINIIRQKSLSLKAFRNARVLFNNSNLYYSISEEMWKHETNLGNIRESFFVSQLEGITNISSSKLVDYLIEIKFNKFYEVEIGGKNKSRAQIKDIMYGLVFVDDKEIGLKNIIPLYLAGFLY